MRLHTAENLLSAPINPNHGKEATMSNHVYKLIELTGSSPTSIDDAIRNAVQKASKSLHNLQWFEVIQTRGYIKDGDVAHFQVMLKIGFTLD
jgi:flavin-binding protein dodecin